ncbi:MAG: MFS transporter [Ktedonobacteraceae bacterium]|nr:MFS transporter [Ktedonobacteraceae bacterium]
MDTVTNVPEPAKKHRFLLNRNFALLWTGQAISELGSHITDQGLPLVANLVLGATSAQMGLLVALGMLPVLLFGLLAGVWVDRLRRRPILIIADLARALLLLSIPVAALLHWLRIEQLYIVAALVGILTVFFDIANQAFLPQLVARERILEANSKLSASSSLAEVGGPTMAGVLVQALTAPIAIVLDALSFLISALCSGLIRVREPRPSVVAERQHVWQDIRAGLHVIVANPVLRAIMLCSSTRNFCGGAFAALYNLYIIRELGMTPLLYGVFVGAGGAGALLGALLANRLAGRFQVGRILVGAALLDGIAMLFTPLAGGSKAAVALLLLGQLIGDFAYAIYEIHALSLRQELVPVHLLGRANASMRVLIEGIVPIGALLAGFVATAISMRLTLLIAACLCCLLSPIWLLCSPVWKQRETLERTSS